MFALLSVFTSTHTAHTHTQGEPYFVRVSAYNMKGFGPARLADPPSAIPSSWHDIDSSQPRYEGKTDQMYALSAELNMMLSHSPPISPCKLIARSYFSVIYCITGKLGGYCILQMSHFNRLWRFFKHYNYMHFIVAIYSLPIFECIIVHIIF